MSGLYDRILDKGMQCEETEDFATLTDFMLQDCTVLDVTNVSYYLASDVGDKSWQSHEFPNVAPPWEKFFVEWSGGWLTGTGAPRAGACFWAIDLLNDDSISLPDLPDELSSNCDPRWMMLIFFVMEPIRGRPVGPMFFLTFWVEESGIVTVKENGDAPLRLVRPQWSDEIEGGELIQALVPALFGLSLLHSKNVDLVDNRPNRVERRRAARENAPAPVIYKTLEIGAIKRVLADEGAAPKGGIRRALHICRGHFATYSPEKPLFGKYSGTYWKPQHVKGSKARGEVIKDYNLKVPK